MAKTKYKFNPHTLNYDKVERSFKKRLLKFLPYAVIIIVLAVLLETFIFSYLGIASLIERKQAAEINFFKEHYKKFNTRMAEADSVLKFIQHRDDNIYRSIFELDPIPMSVRNAGFGGVNRYAHLEGYESSEIVVETTKKLDKLLKKLVVQSKSYDEVVRMADNNEMQLASIPAIIPINSKDLRRVSSYYGYRIHPFYKIRKMHEGMDFSAPTGADIYATGGGVIAKVKTSRSRRGYGNYIDVDHGFGYLTRYAHLSKILVRKGQKVTRGEVIGLCGNSGMSRGSHLHYEVRKNGKSVNPINYYFEDLTPEEYDTMISMSERGVGQSLD